MKVLIIDTETGGLNHKKHSLLTAAFGVYEDGKIIAEKEWLIKHDGYVITPKALEINNIKIIEHDRNAIKSDIVVKEMIEFIKENFEDKPIIVGHNIDFDYRFINKFFLDNGEYLYKYFSHRKLDTCSFVNFLKVTEKITIESASLENCIKYFNIKVNDRHTASEDVRTTGKLLTILNNIITIKEV